MPDSTDSSASSATGRAANQWDLPNVADLADIELADILRHLRRNTLAGKRRAAADPVTRSYLQAGLRLLSRAVSRRAPGDDDGDPSSHPFVSWLSRRLVVEEMGRENSELPRNGSVNGLRDRWDPHSDYISDLLLVAMTAENWSAAVSKGAREHLRALADESLVAIAHDVAYQDFTALERSDGFRVQLLASAMASNESGLHESMTRMYSKITESWVLVYEDLLRSRGLRLRPGFTVTMLSDLLAAMAEGLALRATATTETHLRDDERRQSLLGVGALAVLASVTVSAEGEDQLSFDDHLKSKFGPARDR